MFALADHRIHLNDESLPRDVNAREALALLAHGVVCRPPVSGAVYGTLLNDRAALEALGAAVHEAPYKAPPAAPILYVKPRNSLAGHRSSVVVPDNSSIQVGGSLGIVIGRTASRLSVGEAFDYVAGYTIVGDLSIPHSSVYRPSVRLRARDGFCVVGPVLVASRYVKDPDSMSISVSINGIQVSSSTTATAVRGVAQLVADVTDFMTLVPGDVITMGVPYGSPVARPGDEASITIESWAPLSISFGSKTVHAGEAR
jgi:5-oxopent-3-ene-1,2,5-tricarboxylate decarboxylase/2-hydroxyhepta-2,4-diene-1,7-dioate isomerase